MRRGKPCVVSGCELRVAASAVLVLWFAVQGGHPGIQSPVTSSTWSFGCWGFCVLHHSHQSVVSNLNRSILKSQKKEYKAREKILQFDKLLRFLPWIPVHTKICGWDFHLNQALHLDFFSLWIPTRVGRALSLWRFPWVFLKIPLVFQILGRFGGKLRFKSVF